MRLAASILALLGASPAGSQPLPFDGVVRPRPDGSSVAFLAPPFASNHASSIEALPDGSLLLAWFSGVAEEAPGCAIVVSKLGAGSAQWSAARVVSQRANYSNQNHVLFYDAQSGRVLLWHSQLLANAGEGLDVLWQLSSDDLGETWGEPAPFLDLSHGKSPQGVFDRNRVVPRADGGLIFPGYFTTKKVPNSPFLLFAQPGNHSAWGAPQPIAGAPGLVQPTIVRTAPGTLTAFFRDRSARNVFGATSRDEGATWTTPTPAQAGSLPNNNAGIEAFQLKSGSTILLFNNESGTGVRTPMTAALSLDGGLSWPASRNLQLRGDDNASAVEFSYPTVLQTPDGVIHAAYTYNRATIKYVRFAEGWVTAAEEAEAEEVEAVEKETKEEADGRAAESDARAPPRRALRRSPAWLSRYSVSTVKTKT